MHELSIASALAEQALTIARENRAVRVASLDVEVGVLQQIVPEALHMAFEAVVTGTPIAGATLRLTEVPPEAECRGCGCRFAAAIDVYRCPECGQANARIMRGNEIILRSVECEVEEGSQT